MSVENSEIIKKRELRKAIIEEDRHKELAGVLKGIKDALSKSNDKGVQVAIEKLAAKLEGLKPPEIKMPELKAPDVKVEVSTKEFVTSIDNLAKDLLVELRKFNERPIVSEFKLETGQWGAKTVKVIYKNG